MAASPTVASAIAYAAADLLTATARTWEDPIRGGPLTDAAEAFDRAAHEPHGRTPTRRPPQTGQLRTMARLIATMNATAREVNTMQVMYLITTLAAIVENLAELREAQQRLHQAQATRTAIDRLRAWTPPTSPPTTQPPTVRWKPDAAGPAQAEQRSRQR